MKKNSDAPSHNSFHIARTIISLVVTHAVIVFLIAIYAFHLLPFGKSYYIHNFLYSGGSVITLSSAFKTWDAQHYIFLAEKGYKKGQESNRFYPLFPGLIKIVNSTLQNSLQSGLLLSSVCMR